MAFREYKILYMKIVTSLYLLLVLNNNGFSQSGKGTLDTPVNNLAHTTGYKTCQYDEIPKYVKTGKGSQKMILIPGLGFDASIFKDFIEANKEKYTMYAITLPGYGGTPAPAMPAEGVSYGEQTWNKSAIKGIIKLIEKHKIEKPIIVGHFVQGTQLALRLAIDYPANVSSVIILGGVLKFTPMIGGKVKDFPLATMVSYTDTLTAPKWFRTMSRKTFNAGNFPPVIYSMDSSSQGNMLWMQPAAVPFPVIIRYSCEYFASDIKQELHKIKCPVLAIRPLFTQAMLNNPLYAFAKPYFTDSWDKVSAINPLISVKDIPDAATFIWKDNPGETFSAINAFLQKNNKNPG